MSTREPYYQVVVIKEDVKEFIPPKSFKEEQEARDYYNYIVGAILTEEEPELTGAGLYFIKPPSIPALMGLNVKGRDIVTPPQK